MKFLSKSILRFVLTTLFVTIISFLLIKISPIDPATAYARRFSITSTNEIETIREEMGLNRPVYIQYVEWLSKIIKGDFGNSFVTSKSVFEEIKISMKNTFIIVITSMFIQAFGALIVAQISYLNEKNTIGKTLNKLSVIAISTPPFIVAGIILELLAVKFRVINLSNNEGIARFLPAAISLSINGIAYFGKILHDLISKNMNSNAVFYSKTFGFSEKKIIRKYILCSSIKSILPTFMQMMGMCFAGTMIIEQVFGIPGIGSLLIRAILLRDAPMIHGIVLCLGIIMSIFLIIADIFREGNKRREI